MTTSTKTKVCNKTIADSHLFAKPVGFMSTQTQHAKHIGLPSGLYWVSVPVRNCVANRTIKHRRRTPHESSTTIWCRRQSIGFYSSSTHATRQRARRLRIEYFTRTRVCFKTAELCCRMGLQGPSLFYAATGLTTRFIPMCRRRIHDFCFRRAAKQIIRSRVSRRPRTIWRTDGKRSKY